MTISTLIHRPGMHDIPVIVEVEQNYDGTVELPEYAVSPKPYKNDDMTEVVFDVGDRIYLTRDEQRQIKLDALEQVWQSMTPSQRFYALMDRIVEERGL